MTRSATTPPPNPSAEPSKQQNKSQAKPVGFSWGKAFLTFVFRLLLLGVGGGVAAAVGIAIAQLYPDQPQEPPLLEKLIRSAESLLTGTEQVPQTWSNQPSQPQSPPAVAPSTVPVAPSTGSELTASERQQLQTELTQLQAELQTLTSQSSEPLAERVQEIQTRIQTIQQRLSATSVSQSPSQTFVAPTAASAVNGSNRLMVTLPSDALFADGQTTLRPGTEDILDSVLTDLQRYPEAAIQVAAHTNSSGTPAADRQQSLEQAKAVQQYLSQKLGDQVHWVTIGYGHTRPLASEDSPINQQRNRRIEIVIDPS